MNEPLRDYVNVDRRIEAVAMDMWDPYINSTREHLEDADDKIVFHPASQFVGQQLLHRDLLNRAFKVEPRKSGRTRVADPQLRAYQKRTGLRPG